MIIDANLTFAEAKDAAADVTRAVKAAGTAYRGMVLNVTAAEDIAAVKVALETSDSENGTYRVIHEWPEKTGVKAGTRLVNDAMPWEADKWVRLKLSAPCRINAYLSADAKLEYPVI